MRAPRRLLPVLFTLHFVALLVFPLPRGEGSFGRLPPGLRDPLAAVVPPVASALGGVADPYVRFLSFQQHWGFFAPNPLADTPVLIGTVYGRGPGDPEGSWRDTELFLPSSLDPGAPRLLRDRTSYLLLKGAEIDAHPAYHRTIARWVCEEAGLGAGERVSIGTESGGMGSGAWTAEGVRLRVNWHPVTVPWREGTNAGAPAGAAYAGPIVEDLGGFPCPAR